MTKVLEGTWDEVWQQIQQLPQMPFDKGQPLHVIISGETHAVTNGEGTQMNPSDMLTLGMFPELLGLTDEDFKSAEYHGDADDDLY